jgi:hypothetical protein
MQNLLSNVTVQKLWKETWQGIKAGAGPVALLNITIPTRRNINGRKVLM